MTTGAVVYAERMPSHVIRENAGLLIFYAFVAVLLGALIFGCWSCATSECDEVCSANGDRPRWTWTQGCFCRDADGLYNPADSRDAR
jgi:hypothetical protein